MGRELASFELTQIESILNSCLMGVRDEVKIILRTVFKTFYHYPLYSNYLSRRFHEKPKNLFVKNNDCGHGNNNCIT